MADFVFNIAKGRIVELYNRVENNDPSTSGFKLIPVDVGATTDATIKDFDTLSAVTGGGVTERTTGGWSRKTLTDTELAALPSPDDTNDRYDLDMPDQTWTAVTAGTVTDLILVYCPDTSGADSTFIPLIQFDFAITPDGSDVVAQVNSAGFFRAS